MPRRIVIRFSNIIIFLVLLTTFVPMSVYYVDVLVRAIPVIRLARIILIGYFLLDILVRRKLPERFLGIALFVGIMMISTFINYGAYGNFIDNFSSFVLIVMCGGTHFVGRSDAEKDSFIKTCFFFFATLLFVNLAMMLEFPDGIFRIVYDSSIWYERSYALHFLQTDNRMISFILPLCMIAMVGYKRKVVSKFMCLIALAVSIITVFLTKSATSIIGVFVFIGAAILLPKMKLTPRKARVVVILLIIFPIFFQLVMNSNIVLEVIQKVFGRVDTVLSRFELGQKAMQIISNKPFLGYGTGESGRYFSEGVMTYWVHNHALDLFVQGGVIGYISNLIFIFSAKRQYALRASLPSDILCIFAAVVAILIMGNAESFVYAVEFYFVVSLLEY